MSDGFASFFRLMKTSPFLMAQAIVCALIFAGGYVQAAHVDPQSLLLPPDPASIDVIFRARLMIPALLRHTLPHAWLDTTSLRFVVAFLSSVGVFLLARPVAARLGAEARVVALMPITLLVILLMHYVISKTLNVYYVYDIPAILFYMMAFLLLTDERRAVFWMGIAATVLFAFNRETIMVALFQAAGFWGARGILSKPRSEKMEKAVLLLAALGGVFLIRFALVHLLGGQTTDSVHVYEDGTLRCWANLKRVLRHGDSTYQIFILGGGILFWLGPVLRRVTRVEKGVLIASLVPLFPLLVAGNFTELRIYGELVPLMAYLLARFITLQGDAAVLPPQRL